MKSAQTFGEHSWFRFWKYWIRYICAWWKFSTLQWSSCIDGSQWRLSWSWFSKRTFETWISWMNTRLNQQQYVSCYWVFEHGFYWICDELCDLHVWFDFGFDTAAQTLFYTFFIALICLNLQHNSSLCRNRYKIGPVCATFFTLALDLRIKCIFMQCLNEFYGEVLCLLFLFTVLCEDCWLSCWVFSRWKRFFANSISLSWYKFATSSHSSQ